MNIVAYCRVSTDKEDQLNSLEAQKNFFTEYAKKNGYKLVKIYADEGISGTKIKNRTEFQNLLKDSKLGMFEMIVVKDISRFARNTVDLLQSIRSLKALGIETTFLTANMTVLGQSEFVLTIFAALAQEESANTSKRVKFGKKLNAEKGKVPNMVYGYDKIIGNYFDLTINENESKIIKQIFQWYTNDGYGAFKIAQLLNYQGYKTKRNCNWSQNAICRIITNPIYIGKIINGKEETKDFLTGKRTDKDKSEWMIVDKPEFKIIEVDMFNKANEILNTKHTTFKTNKTKESNKYLFSTIINCKECGWSFRRVVNKYQNTYIRWVCSGRNKYGTNSCCNSIKIDEQELINQIQDYFLQILKSKKSVIEYVKKEFERIYNSKNKDKSYEQELKNKLNKLTKTKQKYMDMYTDDLITREELNLKLKSINSDIENTSKELSFIDYNTEKSNHLEDILDKTFKSIEDVTDVSQITNTQLKNIIKKIEVDKQGNVDIFLHLFEDLNINLNLSP